MTDVEDRSRTGKGQMCRTEEWDKCKTLGLRSRTDVYNRGMGQVQDRCVGLKIRTDV